MSKLSIGVSETDHMQGDPGAEWSLVEYGDYECPHCAAAHPVVKRLQKHFGEQISFVFRNFPLTQIHAWAEPAAEVAEFAGVHGKFWEMHDLLFENQRVFGDKLFLELTERLGLDSSELKTDLEGRTFRARIRADFAGGVRSGVNGTPTFFLNGKRHNGSPDFESLVNAMERAPVE